MPTTHNSYSAAGSVISSSTVGIIDDPNYTVYVGTTGSDLAGKGTKVKPFRTPNRAVEFLRNKFITQNGFATIKCDEGRYTFNKPLELRHPQGDRIGIRGADTNDYFAIRCTNFEPWGEVSYDPTTSTNRGSTRERFYVSKLNFNDEAWTTNNYTNQGVEPGVVNTSTVGDYVLIRDWTFAHGNDYDNVHGELGASGCKRSSLLGSHSIVTNLWRPGVGSGQIELRHRMYNYPLLHQYSKPSAYAEPDQGESIVQFGGMNHEYRDIEDGDLFADPPAYEFPSKPLSGVNHDVFASFGGTFEGSPNFDSTTSVQTLGLTGYRPVAGEQTYLQRFYYTAPDPGSNANHLSLNQLRATHIKTIFEFTNIEEPGIWLDGSQLGFIQNIAIEGPWKQFKKHYVSSGVTLGDAGTLGESYRKRPNAAIFVSNNASLSYDLGKTGDAIAETYQKKHSGTNLTDSDVTIQNVGISGWEHGAYVDSSVAHLEDIVICNCGTGILSTNKSVCKADRSVITGIEEFGMKAMNSSSIDAPRCIVSHVGHPGMTIRYHVKSDGNIFDSQTYQRNFSENSFNVGDPIAIADNSDTAPDPGNIGEEIGIVKNWTSAETPGEYVLTLYDYKGKFSVPSLEDLQTFGLTFDTPSGCSSDASMVEDTDPTTGYLVPVGSKITRNGYAAFATSSSTISTPRSGFFFNYNGPAATRSSDVSMMQSIVSHSNVGVRSSRGGTVRATGSLIENVVNQGFLADRGGVMISPYTIAKNCGQAYEARRTGNLTLTAANAYEGFTRHCTGLLKATSGSMIDGYGDVIYYTTEITDGTDHTGGGSENQDLTTLPNYSQNFVLAQDITSIIDTGNGGQFGGDGTGDDEDDGGDDGGGEG